MINWTKAGDTYFGHIGDTSLPLFVISNGVLGSVLLADAMFSGVVEKTANLGVRASKALAEEILEQWLVKAGIISSVQKIDDINAAFEDASLADLEVQ